MSANVGLAIQCVGIVLVALLSLSMRGSIKSAAVNYWSAAWVCLSLALVSLFIGIHVTSGQKIFFSGYFLGEYAFGLMFVAGCRHYATRARLNRRAIYFGATAVILAVVLPFLSADFNDLFMIHATIFAALLATSALSLRPAFGSVKSSPGLRVMLAALVLLAIDFLHYVPVFGARKGLWGFTVPAGYLQYTSIFDLILEILLGFGTIMVLLEGVRREVEAANYKLTNARDQLESIARMDPLTEALNRHAFHSLLSRGEGETQQEVDGSVAIIDIDNLKPINDTLGHGVGDQLLVQAAKRLSACARAGDVVRGERVAGRPVHLVEDGLGRVVVGGRHDHVTAFADPPATDGAQVVACRGRKRRGASVLRRSRVRSSGPGSAIASTGAGAGPPPSRAGTDATVAS